MSLLVKEFAQRAGVSEDVVRHWIHKGAIPAVRLPLKAHGVLFVEAEYIPVVQKLAAETHHGRPAKPRGFPKGALTSTEMAAHLGINRQTLFERIKKGRITPGGKHLCVWWFAKPELLMKITDLKPDKHNANRGTERGAQMIEQSLRDTGAGRSIVVDKAGQVISGNKTLAAADKLGLPIEVVHSDGQRLVVVQRDDLDLDDPQGAARKMAFLDNSSSEVGLAWDAAQIAADLEAGLDLSGMFDEGELGVILESAANEVLAGEGKEYDESVEAEVEYITCPSCGHRWAK